MLSGIVAFAKKKLDPLLRVMDRNTYAFSVCVGKISGHVIVIFRYFLQAKLRGERMSNSGSGINKKIYFYCKGLLSASV